MPKGKGYKKDKVPLIKSKGPTKRKPVKQRSPKGRGPRGR